MMTDSLSLGHLTVRDVCQIHRHAMNSSSGPERDRPVVALLFLYGSWNISRGQSPENKVIPVLKALIPTSNDSNIQFVVGIVQVDESDESLQLCVGDDGATGVGVCPPSELPSIAVAVQSSHMDRAVVDFVPGIQTTELQRLLLKVNPNSLSLPDAQWSAAIQEKVDAVFANLDQSVKNSNKHSKCTNGAVSRSAKDDAVRIFVAGDRSSVGKSSCALGLLGNLVIAGYKPSELAYIKPATQCEAPQPVEAYCRRVGIDCVPVGPIVYYKGFTRAFLAGETESSDQLLVKAGTAVDKAAQGKRLIMIDGVGFPAVGSICGTDNASVARATGYPQEFSGDSRNPPAVLLVGGSGVGAAVDAFNLNATYFEARQVPVIGAIFNKLSLEGFYSLENCKSQVTKYFERFQSDRQPFGFVPLVPDMSGDQQVDDFIRIFGEYVDVERIVEAASRIKISTPTEQHLKRNKTLTRGSAKRLKVSHHSEVLTREQIELRAKQAGAAAGA